jgi:hypothetical protein
VRACVPLTLDRINPRVRVRVINPRVRVRVINPRVRVRVINPGTLINTQRHS